MEPLFEIHTVPVFFGRPPPSLLGQTDTIYIYYCKMRADRYMLSQ